MAEDRLAPIIESAFDKLSSTAAASGYFERVLTHEPKSAPGTGLTFSAFLGPIRPIAPYSGLAVTSARVLITCRIYSPMLAEPQDRIDIDLAKASSYMLAQLTGDFGITGAYLDLLGSYGIDVSATPGYVELDRSMFRITDTTAPFIADDVFTQEV